MNGVNKKARPSAGALKKSIFEPTKCETCGAPIITDGDVYKALVKHLEEEHPEDGKV